MRKIIYRETRVQGTWRLGSENRCSISSTERVVEIEEKKRAHLKIGAIFEGIGRLLMNVANIVVAIGKIAGLIASILSLLA